MASGGDAEQRTIADGPLTVQVGPRGEFCVVRVIGELDSQNAGTLTTELYRLFASELDTVVLDLEGLEFIDSAGLRCLLVHARANPGRLRIVSVNGQVDRVLRLTGIREALPFIGS